MGKTGQRIQGGVALLVLAGAGSAWYVYNHDPALKRQFSQAVSGAKPIPEPPANAPVGFNATRTAFVLPHKLGYLPAPELALAKSDPTYAAGLANLGDWQRYIEAAVMQGGPKRIYWAYTAGLHPQGGTSVGNIKFFNGGEFVSLFNDTAGLVSVRDRIITTRVIIHDSTPHVVYFSPNTPTGVIAEYVAPSAIEIAAAPVRINSQQLPEFCTPSPLAYIENHHVFTPPILPRITAGPATIFSEPVTGGMGTQVQGTTSCNGFS